MSRFVFVLALALAGCAGSDTTCEGYSPVRTAPADFEVVVGQGGGFTGAWSGHRLRPGGAVERWTSTPGEDRVFEPAGGLVDSAVVDVWTHVEPVTLTDEVSTPGNVSRTLEVTADGRTQRFTWEPSAGPDQNAYYDDVWDRVSAHLASAR